MLHTERSQLHLLVISCWLNYVKMLRQWVHWTGFQSNEIFIVFCFSITDTYPMDRRLVLWFYKSSIIIYRTTLRATSKHGLCEDLMVLLFYTRANKQSTDGKLFLCRLCRAIKKKSQKSSKKAPLWLSTNNFSSWNFKMWSTGNVKRKFYRHKKHLPALDGMTFGKLLSQFNKQIRKFKQLENLGNGVSPALTVLSQQKLLKQRNFIFKCSIPTFLFRHKFWFFPPQFGWPRFHLSA